MSTTVGYVIEVKRNDNWEPVLPLDLKPSVFENDWVFETGGLVEGVIHNNLNNNRGFPKDSPTIQLMEQMYPKHKSKIREWLLKKFLSGPHSRFMGWLYRTLICKFRNVSGAFEHTWSHSWATYGDIEDVVDKLEEDIRESIKDYSSHNVLINEVREAMGKPQEDDYVYDIYTVMEYIYTLEAWECFKGGIRTLAEAKGVYNGNMENIRVIWWME